MDETVHRWSDVKYMSKMLQGTASKSDEDVMWTTEYSESNHFMYWNEKRNRKGKGNLFSSGDSKEFVPPTEFIEMTFDDWFDKASVRRVGKSDPHWYFRATGCARRRGCPKPDFTSAYKEIPIFEQRKSLFVVEPEQARGIHCRFGMNGVIAENHFDGSRNFVALFGGERRYILAHPLNCPNMYLLPPDHPSGRHSECDWSDIDLKAFPKFEKINVNEVVLQPGDVLYLPTHWFHYIISLNLNYQCNARSGRTRTYDQNIRDCGF